jgi:hypothetical protein
MSAAARSLLVDLDAGLVKLNAGMFPNPADIRAAVSTARDMLAVLLQDLEEMEARVGLMEDVK